VFIYGTHVLREERTRKTKILVGQETREQGTTGTKYKDHEWRG
jgi:hypothetical protein